MKTNLLFVAAMCGLIVLGAATLIANRLLFAEQQGLQDVFSIIWSVALCVLAYKVLRYLWPASTTSQRSWQQNVYSAFLFITEILALVALVFAAVVASILLTADGSNTQLILVTAFVTGSGLALIAVPRVVRLLAHRSARTARHIDT